LSKVILKGFIIVPEADLNAVIQELPTHIELSRKETGCLTFTVTQDKNDKHKFNVLEEFTNIDAFEKHQDRVRSSVWSAVTKNIKRYYKKGKY
jgi:(4S)-4-hydroxy-5-phosphonooxypentane-2,3-dione isomerase